MVDEAAQPSDEKSRAQQMGEDAAEAFMAATKAMRDETFAAAASDAAVQQVPISAEVVLGLLMWAHPKGLTSS